MAVGKTVGAKVCALPKCGQEFTPVVRWQKCCCKAHAVRLRWLRRRDRINKALELVERKVS